MALRATSQVGGQVVATDSGALDKECVQSSVTLHTYEYCSSKIGIWSRAWFATNAEAEAERRRQLASFGRDPDEIDADEELTGEYGQVGQVSCVAVPVTPDGILQFAQQYGNSDE